MTETVIIIGNGKIAVTVNKNILTFKQLYEKLPIGVKADKENIAYDLLSIKFTNCEGLKVVMKSLCCIFNNIKVKESQKKRFETESEHKHRITQKTMTDSDFMIYLLRLMLNT